MPGYWVSQALYVAAKLGVADLLADGPRPVEALASATQTDAPSLRRVLRALASVGVFTQASCARSPHALEAQEGTDRVSAGCASARSWTQSPACAPASPRGDVEACALERPPGAAASPTAEPAAGNLPVRDCAVGAGHPAFLPRRPFVQREAQSNHNESKSNRKAKSMARIGLALSGGLASRDIVDCVRAAEDLGYESAWMLERCCAMAWSPTMGPQ
jgi:hypothetical protein